MTGANRGLGFETARQLLAQGLSVVLTGRAADALQRAHSCRADGVLVNAVDPGWVRTDMGGASAPRSPQEGADTTVWLATLPDDGPAGGFFRDRRPIQW